MASKQTKQKPEGKARRRNAKIKVSDLQVRKGGVVKGGVTSSTTMTESCSTGSHIPIGKITI